MYVDPESNAEGHTKKMLDLMRRMRQEAYTNPGGPVRYASTETYDEPDERETEEYQWNWLNGVMRR